MPYCLDGRLTHLLISQRILEGRQYAWMLAAAACQAFQELSPNVRILRFRECFQHSVQDFLVFNAMGPQPVGGHDLCLTIAMSERLHGSQTYAPCFFLGWFRNVDEDKCLPVVKRRRRCVKALEQFAFQSSPKHQSQEQRHESLLCHVEGRNTWIRSYCTPRPIHPEAVRSGVT